MKLVYSSPSKYFRGAVDRNSKPVKSLGILEYSILSSVLSFSLYEDKLSSVSSAERRLVNTSIRDICTTGSGMLDRKQYYYLTLRVDLLDLGPQGGEQHHHGVEAHLPHPAVWAGQVVLQQGS